MSSRTLKLAALSLTSLLAVSSANAQGSIELGGFGAYTQFDSTLGLREQGGGGGRLSLFSGAGWSQYALEVEGAIAMSAVGPQEIRYLPARARLLYAVPVGGPAALLIGGGGVRNDYHDGDSSSVEWGYTGLVGLKLQMGSFMALRIDGVMDYVANPVNEAFGVEKTINKTIQAGLSFPLWRDKVLPPMREPRVEPRVEPRPEPVPVQPAPVIVQQAPREERVNEPDADRDGVPDSRDACANTMSGTTVDTQGCAVYRDTDGDGVTDVRDACPATTAGVEIDGRGCPLAKDSDMDGVADANDRCPNTPRGESVNAVGCNVVVVKQDIDSDNDGVPDSRDRCPATPAGTAADASGCPILFKNTERTVTLRGVNFAAWKSDIVPAAAAVLDEVARQLIAAPNIRVEVAGHTSGAGNRDANIKLSLERAEAVRGYLIMQGVAADRLVARGYGPDQPIGSNKTDSGRAMNRRVELRRID